MWKRLLALSSESLKAWAVVKFTSPCVLIKKLQKKAQKVLDGFREESYTTSCCASDDVVRDWIFEDRSAHHDSWIEGKAKVRIRFTDRIRGDETLWNNNGSADKSREEKIEVSQHWDVYRDLTELIYGKHTRIKRRVWSWLRTNAGGVLNTCKSNGSTLKACW